MWARTAGGGLQGGRKPGSATAGNVLSPKHVKRNKKAVEPQKATNAKKGKRGEKEGPNQSEWTKPTAARFQ